MLSEINQIKTKAVSYHLHAGSNKYNKQVNKTKKNQTHSYREKTSGYQCGEERGEGLYSGREKKGYHGLCDVMCVKLLKFVRHYRI